MGINITDPKVNGIPTPKLYAGVRGLELLKGRDGKTFDLILPIGLDIDGEQKGRERVTFLNRPEISEEVEKEVTDPETKEVSIEPVQEIRRESQEEIPPEILEKLNAVIAWAYDQKINAAYPGDEI